MAQLAGSMTRLLMLVMRCKHSQTAKRMRMMGLWAHMTVNF